MEGYRREPVWDPVTRLWHWLLAASVITGWALGEFRTFSIMQWHIYLGYFTGALLLFRFAWGWAGPAPVRHRTLFAALCGIPAYLRQVGVRRPSGVPGHNPVGALSVIAMVLALTAQVVTGLFSEDDALFHSGPLASEVSSDIVGTMTSYHNLFAKVVLVLVALHVAAILFYLAWKRENLIAPMLHGRKWVKDRPREGTDQNPPNHLDRSSAAPIRARTALLQGEPGDAAAPQRPEAVKQDDQSPREGG